MLHAQDKVSGGASPKIEILPTVNNGIKGVLNGKRK